MTKLLRRKVIWSVIILILCLSLATSAHAQGEAPPSTLDVVIPDYEVTTEEGIDHVEIPGGKIATVVGKPMIPYYTTPLDYPEGYVVQDVVLIERSSLETATGLNIPDYVPQPDMPGGEGTFYTCLLRYLFIGSR